MYKRIAQWPRRRLSQLIPTALIVFKCSDCRSGRLEKRAETKIIRFILLCVYRKESLGYECIRTSFNILPIWGRVLSAARLYPLCKRPLADYRFYGGILYRETP